MEEFIDVCTLGLELTKYLAVVLFFMNGERFDVIIVGGGITGTSLLYLLSNYTDIKKILLIEKYDSLAPLNSSSRNNSQTLHFGDIETNYSLDKAKKTKKAAEIVLRYTEALPTSERKKVIAKCQKMVLAVGDRELESMDKVYSKGMRELFPGLKKLGKKEIARVEPNIVKGRDPEEKIGALLSDKGYMVDFGQLTRSFGSRSKKSKSKIRINTKAVRIEKDGGEYNVITTKGNFSARFVVFATGAYSLYFAKSLGYEKNLSILSVAGNFYVSKRVLNGKVYRMQTEGIPFAAIHGDPDITNSKITRFGPTVTLPLQLERHKNDTMLDYIKTFDIDLATMASLKRILFNKDIQRILSRNISYYLPIIGKELFLRNEAGKIVPSLRAQDLVFANDQGGIRPQVIDEKKGFLVIGESKIVEDGIIFNITPSPGASSSLANSLEDVGKIAKYLGSSVDSKELNRKLLKSY